MDNEIFNSMATPINKVEDKLYIGNLEAALDIELIKSHKISHIVQIFEEVWHTFPEQLNYHFITIDDSIDINIQSYFNDAFEFINKGITVGTGVLVHCQMGQSRSATIVLSYLMKKYKSSFRDALATLKLSRPCVKPNIAFELQLKQYEKQIGYGQ